MPLPGWNVSEPIDLAYKLYEVVEALRSAPDSAKAFVTKINNFSGNLKELQRILEGDTATHSAQDFEHLRNTVLQCQACVKRCEDYSEGFAKLTRDGRGRLDGAGQAARWTFQERKVARLREEIDAEMHNIGLTLQIKAFAEGRTRQGSDSGTQTCSPLRSDTWTSLPPYSSPEPNWVQTGDPQHPKTPADLLGIGTSHERKTSDPDVPNFLLGRGESKGKGIMVSPQRSPNTLRLFTEPSELSELDSKENMRSLERCRNTTDAFALSATGLGISSAVSQGSSAASRVFTSPMISSRRTSITDATNSSSRRDSIFALEHAVLEMAIENLSGVQASYYKAKSRISYPVSTIEAFRDEQTRRRYIIISPPKSSNIRLYFVPPIERIIPHSEHPNAYGSTNKYRVKFIEPYLLRSQKISLDRQPSDASKTLSPSLTPVSSAASVASSRSLGSPILTTNSGVLKEESRRQEYDFENIEDYRKFQELLMGPDVKLQLQVPIQSITAKKYKESKLTPESKLQYLRLWEYDGHQILMFFANLSSNKYREYRMEHLRPVQSKSKTTISLDVHLPGMVRRRSSSKAPIPITASTAQEQAREGGYIDENDMTDLDFLSIEFSYAIDRTMFLHQARFHGSAEEPAASPFSLHSRSTP